MNKTQVKLIEAAEWEFAEKGFHGSSIRDITARAEANIASVNYHFGSKETLFIEMIRYRLEPLNTLRLQMLEQAVAQSGKAPLSVKTIVDILIRPLLKTFASPSRSKKNHSFLRAMGRGMSEESKFMEDIYKDVLATLVERFRNEIRRSLSDLPEEMAFLCFAYLRSTMSGVMQIRKNNLPTGTSIQFPDADSMVSFISGGIESIATDYRTRNK